MLLVAYQALSLSTIGRATSTLVLAGKVYLTPVTTGRATSLVTISAIGNKIFDAMDTTGRALSAMSLTAKIPMTAASTGRATSSMELGGAFGFACTTTGRATSAFTILSTGYMAPPERTMNIPYEDRTMAFQ